MEQSTNYGANYGVVSDYVVLTTGEMISGDGWIPDADFNALERDYYINTIKIRNQRRLFLLIVTFLHGK